MAKVEMKETGEMVVGGLVGVPLQDYVSEYISSRFGQEGWRKFGVKLAWKLAWGVGLLAAAYKIEDKYADLSTGLQGFSEGPIFTLSSDALSAAGWSPVAVGALKGRAARAKAGKPAAAPAAPRVPAAPVPVVVTPAMGAAVAPTLTPAAVKIGVI